MAVIGHGYGSEWHLLRFLGRHRQYFNRLILDTTGGAQVTWLDVPFRRHRVWRDSELLGIDFVRDDRVRKAWFGFWPQSGNVQNWDAVGTLRMDSIDEFLLVEAKAYVGEHRSDCAAKPEGGLSMIVEALNQTKRAFGAPSDADWLHGYYQYCNRLATLFFLLSHGIGARLLFVYFVGDTSPKRFCPVSAAVWRQELAIRTVALGITSTAPLASRVHELFVPVGGPEE